MCSSAGDIEDFNSCVKEVKNNLKKELFQKCKKCSEKSIVLLQKKDPFCKGCFYEYCNHKFRSTIGKSKKIKHGDKVLLAYSGGQKSATLLHMTQQTLQTASLKQISFMPGILFIDENFILSERTVNKEFEASHILKYLKGINYPILYSSLEMVYKVNNGESLYSSLSSVDTIPTDILPCCDDLKVKLNENFKDMPLSSTMDLLKHLRLLLITEIANQAGYDCIFTGDTASSLAVDLLSDIACGRGSQILSDTCFYDTRYKVPVCRPLREFSNKEIAMYNHLHGVVSETIPDFLTKTPATSSIQRLSETFLSNLQENFPATVFTVFRTGGKLSRNNMNEATITCIICKSQLDNVNPDPCSALEALKVSERLSTSVLECKELLKDADPTDLKKFLCHGCSVTFQNMAGPQYFHSLITGASCVQMERDEMREEIKDFLIEENDIDS